MTQNDTRNTKKNIQIKRGWDVNEKKSKTQINFKRALIYLKIAKNVERTYLEHFEDKTLCSNSEFWTTRRDGREIFNFIMTGAFDLN